MAYPITGELCKLTSVTPASAGTYDMEYLLETALRDVSLTYNERADQEDVTGKGDGYRTFSQGLHSATLDFKGRWPRSAPRFGASGNLTLGSSSLYLIEGWTLDIDFGEEDITSFTGAAQGSRVYRPAGFPEISGSIQCRASSGAALAAPAAIHASAENVTFKLTEDGASDPGFTATMLLGTLSTTAGGRQLIRPRYDFVVSGQMTSVAGSTLPGIFPDTYVVGSTGGTAAGSTTWDTNSDGTPDMTVVWQNAASRTYSAAAFLRTLRIECMVGQIIDVSGQLRISGAVTPA